MNSSVLVLCEEAQRAGRVQKRRAKGGIPAVRDDEGAGHKRRFGNCKGER